MLLSSVVLEVNTDPTTLVATATSGSQKRDARPGQLDQHENREIRRGDEFLIYDLHHHKAGSSNNYKDSKPPVNPGSSYESDQGEPHYGDADGDDDESYDDGFDSSGYGESVDGTWYPVLGPEPTHYDESPRPSDAASAAAFSSFQALPNTSQSFICLLTLSKTVTVTSTDDSLPLVPTDTFRWTWTEVVGTTIDTTVTSTKTATVLTGPIITCVADPASNILVNGGFDDSVADQWGDIDPTPWGWAGGGWGPTFLGSSPGGLTLNTQTPSNLLYFPGDDDGADFEVWQDSTNLDTSLNYTVSFWYRLPSLSARPYNPGGHGPCPFSVTWGGYTIFTKGFDQGDVNDDWKHVNSPINLSPQSPNARLDIKMHCSPTWLGLGVLSFFIDSVAIYPSNELVCDGA
ncbi:hypothetical protein G7054_g641 [Neopestalotiopsis clavispora]|nr:hypothetical protein G7054_g641 [Neopestalotiopsis clavispora]